MFKIIYSQKKTLNNFGNCYRQLKTTINIAYNNVVFRCFRAYAIPVSMNNRNKLRIHKGFESKENAVQRTAIEKLNIEQVSFQTS